MAGSTATRARLPRPRLVRVAIVALAALVTAAQAVPTPVVMLAAPSAAPAPPPPNGGAGVPPAAASGSSLPAAVPAFRQANNVAVITIRGMIDAVTAMSVERRMKRAQTDGADAIVFDLDTPGGEVGAVLEICTMIKQSPIANTVAWVNPQAYSGGAIIALACREIIVSPYATMGDAAPISALPFLGLQQLPDTERQKILSPLLAEIVDSARRRGIDERLVEAFVTLGVELWLVENVETGETRFADSEQVEFLVNNGPEPRVQRILGSTEFVAQSPRIAGETSESVTLSQDLPRSVGVFEESDRGRWRVVERASSPDNLLTIKTDRLRRYGFAIEIVRDDAELARFFGAANIARLDRNWSEGLVRVMSSFWVRGLLVAVFLIGLVIEMASPGVGIAGGVSLVALAGLVAPSFLVGAAAWWGIAAVFGGIALVLTEVFLIPGFGLAGVGGMILLFVGLLGLVVGPGGLFPNTPQQQEDLIYGVVTVLLAIFSAGVAAWFVSKKLGSIPVFNRLILKERSDDEERPGMLEAMAPAVRAQAREGDVGVAMTPLRPAGRAMFEDRMIDVVSGFGHIERGERVRVTEAGKFRIVVERVEPQGNH